MLCITLRPGEYFTVGGETVVLFDQLHGDRIHISIDAPRSVPIVRSTVLERSGAPAPQCIVKPPQRKKRRPRSGGVFQWNGDRERAVRALEKLAARLEKNGAAEEARILRVQTGQIVPTPWEEEVTVR